VFDYQVLLTMKEKTGSEKKAALTFGRLWKEIPTVAKLIGFGLIFISGFVIGDFIRLVSEGPLVPGEDLYIHMALLFLVPGSTLMLFVLSFGYSYYQICKRNGLKPFWQS
jgi:hypothetical protein